MTKDLDERAKEMPVRKDWSVIYGNYYPREVDSYWATKEEAEAECSRLSEEQRAQGLGSGMWEVEYVGDQRFSGEQGE